MQRRYWRIEGKHAVYNGYDVYLYNALPLTDWLRQIMAKPWGHLDVANELCCILAEARGEQWRSVA